MVLVERFVISISTRIVSPGTNPCRCILILAVRGPVLKQQYPNILDLVERVGSPAIVNSFKLRVFITEKPSCLFSSDLRLVTRHFRL